MNITTSALFALASVLASGEQESYLGARTSLPLFADELEEDPDVTGGLPVVAVTENSPAAAAGLQAGDEILRVDDEPVRSPRHLEALVAEKAPGTVLRIEVRRGNRIFDVETRTVPYLVPREFPPPRYVLETRRLRLAVADVEPETARRAGLKPGTGVRVQRFLEGSEADGRLEVGDVLLRFGDADVHGTDDFLVLAGKLEPGARLEVEVLRAGEVVPVRLRVLRPDRYLTNFHVPLIVRYKRDAREDETSFYLLFWIFNYHRQENRSSWRFFWLLHLEFGTNEELEELES